MSIAFEVSRALSILAFLGYGLVCLFSDHMAGEFERFGLSRFRRLTGLLEVLGGIGLLASYAIPPLAILASAGLTLLMVLGVLTRVRVRDSFLETLPALVLGALNLYILVEAVEAARLA